MDRKAHDGEAAPPEPDAEGDQETKAPPPPNDALPMDEDTEGQVDPAGTGKKDSDNS